MVMQWSCRSYAAFFTILLASALIPGALASDFAFKRYTLSFVNSTVFDYSEGQARVRKSTGGKEKKKAYTRRCFVMSRAAMQFRKFARFDPHGAPLNDQELAARVRQVTRTPPWHEAWSPERQVTFPR